MKKEPLPSTEEEPKQEATQEQGDDVEQEQQPLVPTDNEPVVNQAPGMEPAPLYALSSKEVGKMFIGGLNWDTTEDGLVNYFSKYGEILDRTIMRDPATGRSRGFGFLTFKEASSVDEVLKKDHILDGKLIDPKKAIAKEEQDKVGKIFVGGIDPFVTEEDFNEFFSKFGRIIDAQLMIDKDTGRSRGFGFITYDSPEAVEKVCVNKYLTLKDKAMEVKRAEPRGHYQQLLQQQQLNQFNPFNTYGQFQMQYSKGAPEASGGSSDAVQDYWQRIQWYMMQQQQAEASGEPSEAEAPEFPLNPQQQNSNGKGSRERRDDGSKSRDRGHGKGRPGRGKFGGGRERRSGRSSEKSPPSGPKGSQSIEMDDGRTVTLPSGPKRLPSGPANGRGRGGYKRGGFHPYKRGRR